MTTQYFKENQDVTAIIEQYPIEIQDELLFLRKLIKEVAKENDEIGLVTETIKWGEPSYVSNHSSTMRMDWKPNQPNQYALYFQCTSQLVPTFKSVFGDELVYEGNRAIIFNVKDKIQTESIKKCVKAALSYHKVKKLPYLGMA